MTSRHLTLFTRTILSRLDFQDVVRQVSVRVDATPNLLDNQSGAPLTETRNMLFHKMQSLNIRDEFKHRLSTDITSGKIHPVLLLLVANQERLEALNVALTLSQLNNLVDVFDSDVAGPYFSKLTSLSLGVVPGESESESIRLGRLLPFYLPCLQKFTVHCCVGDYTDFPPLGLPPNTINIPTISLVNCCLTGRR